MRFTVMMAAGLISAGCDAAPSYPDVAVPVSGPHCTDVVLWSADHESGDLSQWYAGEGGGEFNSGIATSVASDDVAHAGRYSVKTTIETPNTPDTSGVRLFRWKEGRAHGEACYGAWSYFPRRYHAPRWWNILQFKSRDETVANDTFWQLQVGNRLRGAMYVYLTWSGPPIEGPRRGEHGLRHFQQSLKDVLPRRWTHLEVYLRQSSAFDGQIVVWQDGVELFNMNNVRTQYPSSNGANEWSLNNYSEMIRRSPTTIYYDDVVIRGAASGPRRVSR